MSFDADPRAYSYSTAPNVCPLCFPVGKTPLDLFVSFSGITTGTFWSPPQLPPPNGVFKVRITNPCWWTVTGPPVSISLQASAGASLLSANLVPFAQVFQGGTLLQCGTWIENDFQDPTVWDYVGGYAMILDPTVTGGLVDDEILNLFGIPPQNPLWTTPRPISDQETVFTLSARIDKTNIKIRSSTP